MIGPAAGSRSRAPAVGWAIFVAIVAALALVTARNPTSRIGASAGVVACFLAFVVVNHRQVFAWRTMISTIVLVLLFLPIRRYEFSTGLPFNLEIYRLVLLLAGAFWLTSLAIDPSFRFQRSILDVPLAMLALIYLASIAASGNRLNQAGLSGAAIKQYSLFFSFLLLYFLITTATRRFEDVETTVRVLVGGGAIVALFSLVEARTQWNAFDHLATLLPFLKRSDQLTADALARGGHTRVFASAQHPIALSALLIMLVPLGAYLAERTSRNRWWLATLLLLGAALGTLSRTGILMLLVIVVVFFVLRPRDMRTFVRRTRKFILPLLIAVHFALPGTLGTFHDLFLANGGVIAQQQGGDVGSGRVASFGPGMAVIGQHPLLGLGYGTRITDGESPFRNSFITDDGWLSTGMEAGLVGVGAWIAIFLIFLLRLGAAARRDRTERGRLLAALAASATAFAVGMATYDALSFLQVALTLFIVLALGASAYRATGDPLAKQSVPDHVQAL